MRRLTAVVVGCGAIAREHLASLAKLGNVDVVAVCDLSPAKAEATAERYGIAKWYTGLDELLAQHKPDLVHITTPPSSHFLLAKECLSAGLNVLCEKPITIEYAQFVQLRQLAEQNNCLLMENQQFRLHSSIQRIQALVSSGAIGEVLDVKISISLNIVDPAGPYADRNAPHFGLSLRGGVIGDFLPHIAYLLHIFAGRVVDLRALWLSHLHDSTLPSDEFRCLLKTKSGTGYVSFSGNAQPNSFLVGVTGTRMRVEADLFEPPRLVRRRHRDGEPALACLANGLAESRDVLWGSVAGFWRKLGGRSSYDGLTEFISQTYRAIELREPQPVPLEELAEIVRLVEWFTRADVSI